MNRLSSALSETASPGGNDSDISVGHRHLYRSSSLAPTEVDLVTATSNLNTPLWSDPSLTPLAYASQGNHKHQYQEHIDYDPLAYLYDDPRTPYFKHAERNGSDPHGWLHPVPNPVSASSQSSQPQANRSRNGRNSGLGFGSLSRAGQEGDASTSLDGSGRQTTYSLNDLPSSSNTSHSSSPQFNSPYSTSAFSSHRRQDPDRFVKAVITAHPQTSLSLAAFPTSPGLVSGKRAGRSGSSLASLQPPGNGTVKGERGSGGLGLKVMARGGDGKIAVAGNETLRILTVTPPTSPPQGFNPSENTNLRSSLPRAPIRLGSGPGGYKIDQIADLWKGLSGMYGGSSSGRAGGGRGAGKTVNAMDWAVGSMNKKILCACANGNYMIFDAEQGRMDREVSGGQARSLLTIATSKVPDQGHRVLTGGVDGTTKLWDLRQPSKSPPVLSIRHPSPVVSLTFSPPGLESTSAANSYLLGLENGSIYRYEWRMGGRYVGRMTAAHGNRTVTALEWKPASEWDGALGGGGWLASAGLDKTVKIWDMSTVDNPGQPFHVIQAPHPVRRIAWRPGHDTEIAVLSSPDNSTIKNQGPMSELIDPGLDSLEADDLTQSDEARLEIWDVRRGHIPKYLLGKAPRHTEAGGGVVTDISWPEEGAIQSTYSNGAFVQHDVRQHFRPLDHLPKQVIGWSPRGEATIVMDRFVKGEAPFDDIKEEHIHNLASVGRRPKAVSDKAFQTRQTCLTTELSRSEEEVFRYLALQYRLPSSGNPDSISLCAWNALVAEEAESDNAAHIWKLLSLLLATKSQSIRRKSDLTIIAENSGSIQEILPKQTGANIQLRLPSSAKSVPDRTDSIDPLRSPSTTTGIKPFAGLDFTSVNPSNEPASIAAVVNNDSSDSDTPPATSTMPLSLSRSKGLHPMQVEELRNKLLNQGLAPGGYARSPMLHPQSQDDSDSDDDVTQLSASILGTTLRNAKIPYPGSSSNADVSLVRRASPAQALLGTRRRSSGISNSDLHTRRIGLRSAQNDPTNVVEVEQKKSLEQWIRTLESLLQDAIDGALTKGDVQLVATLLSVSTESLVTNAERRSQIIESYIELLDRGRLFTVSADIRLSFEILRPVTLVETSIHLRCGRCRKAKEADAPEVGRSTAWYCGSCKQALSYCMICRLPIEGMRLACKSCNHAGHWSCLDRYTTHEKQVLTVLESSTPKGSPRRSSSPADIQVVWTANKRRHESPTPTESERRYGSRPRVQSSLNLAEYSEADQDDNGGLLCPTGCGCKCDLLRFDERNGIMVC